MNPITLISLFEKDLLKLISELEQYKKEENIWLVEKNISNSAGNLVLHLIGNLNTFIGKEIGKSDYKRDRDLEFSRKNVSREHMIEDIKNVIKLIKDSLTSITEEEIKNDYPIMKYPEIVSTEYVLINLISHLTYHLGQINYHRRLLDETF